MSILDLIFGRPLASHEEEDHKIGPLAGVPVLGLDALASAAYGPEAALSVLIPLGAAASSAASPVIMVIVGILALLYVSYRQTMFAYPRGGGSYTVASANLGRGWGLLAAAALLLDYVLVVAVGVAAGVGALVSALPNLHGHLLSLCLLILAVIALINLRGVRESGLAFSVPTYLFVATTLWIVGVGVWRVYESHGHPLPIVPPVPPSPAVMGISTWLLLRAFASGCTAMTGVEAVSNGIGAFAEPRVRNAQRTLTFIVVVLGILLVGIAYLARSYGIVAMDQTQKGYDSLLSQLIAAIVGRGPLYYVTIASVLGVLALSANTGFADFPRLCRILAQDDYLPRAFAYRGRRLVYSIGIGFVFFASALLLIVFGGVTDRLIPLFAIGALLAFTLSQAGMVVYWIRGGNTGLPMFVNGVGAVGTGAALIVVFVAKFSEGAWITMLTIPALFGLFCGVRRHYDAVAKEIECERPIEPGDFEPPVVVVPIRDWDVVAEKAMRFALRISPDVYALHVMADDVNEGALLAKWECFVEGPLSKVALTVPKLFIVKSSFRQFLTPLFGGIEQIKAQHQNRTLAIIVPELVPLRWWHNLLHNHRAIALKAALLLRGDPRLVVINVPWYLDGSPRKARATSPSAGDPAPSLTSEQTSVDR